MKPNVIYEMLRHAELAFELLPHPLTYFNYRI